RIRDRDADAAVVHTPFAMTLRVARRIRVQLHDVAAVRGYEQAADGTVLHATLRQGQRWIVDAAVGLDGLTGIAVVVDRLRTARAQIDAHAAVRIGDVGEQRVVLTADQANAGTAVVSDTIVVDRIIARIVVADDATGAVRQILVVVARRRKARERRRHRQADAIAGYEVVMRRHAAQ